MLLVAYLCVFVFVGLVVMSFLIFDIPWFVVLELFLVACVVAFVWFVFFYVLCVYVSVCVIFIVLGSLFGGCCFACFLICLFCSLFLFG